MMNTSVRRGRTWMLAAAAAGLTAAAGAALPHAATAASSANCKPVTLNRFLKPAASGTFGAFQITATGVGCESARAIAGAYAKDPYAVGGTRRTTTLDGWRCTWGSAGQVAQAVAVTCTQEAGRVHFTDRLPSG